MKTAISIPDPVFESAERLAREMGVSRSELYVTALRSYLESRDRGSVTAKLDEVYGREDSRLDPALQKLQTRSIGKDSW